MHKNLVVQFNENHKWCGCLGIIDEIKDCDGDLRYLVAVPIPKGNEPDNKDNVLTTYIFVMQSENALEYIGEAVLT